MEAVVAVFARLGVCKLGFVVFCLLDTDRELVGVFEASDRPVGLGSEVRAVVDVLARWGSRKPLRM